MVAAKGGSEGTGRPMLGKALLTLGGIFLVAQVAVFSWHVNQYWHQADGHAADHASALGMALVHVVNTVAWNPGVALASAAKVLVSCWPLVPIAAGIVMLKKNTGR